LSVNTAEVVDDAGFIVRSCAAPGVGARRDVETMRRVQVEPVRRGLGGDAAGLGLSIVHTIARAHGGSAHAADRPEGGADVWLVLPKRPAP
jgi:signal transduction histidine kinase